MDWLNFNFINNDFVLGIAASLSAAIIFAIVLRLYQYIKHTLRQKSIDTELTGYWIVTFSNKYSPQKVAVEIYKFKKNLLSGSSGSKYRFRYQHYNNTRYTTKPLLGGGIALSKGNQVAGIYGFEEQPKILGALLLKADTTTKGKHSPRLLGSYYEYDDKVVSQTRKDEYILYKTHLPLFNKIKFTLGRGCMKSYEEIHNFYTEHEGHKIFGNELSAETQE